MLASEVFSREMRLSREGTASRSGSAAEFLAMAMRTRWLLREREWLGGEGEGS